MSILILSIFGVSTLSVTSAAPYAASLELELGEHSQSIELAEWKMHHQHEGAKLTIGVEEDFGNARYIRRRFG